jgi:CHAT domain-containing protein/Tfp pilus assembly protein PilF
MHPRLRYLSLAATTLLLAVTSPLLPLTSHLAPLRAQAQTAPDRKAEAVRLNEEGVQQLNRGQFREALQKFQQALVIVREIGERKGEGVLLSSIGLVYDNLGQYPKALDFYQQALAIRKEVGDKAGEGVTLNNIGAVYSNLGQYPKALEFYQQALAIRKEVGDKEGEGAALNNIASVYSNLGQYPKALEFFQQTLAIVREIGEKAGEGVTLNNIGAVYNYLGQYPKALEFYQQALAIRKEVGDKAGEGGSLTNIGAVYDSLGQYPKALEFYQQALAIVKEVGDKATEGTTLNNIGEVYRNLAQYPKALEFYQQALAIVKEIGNKAGEGVTLDNIGSVYDNLAQYPKALEFYQQALAIRKEIGDKAGEGKTLNNIGYLLAKQNQPELAIVFYKQSVNVREAIRQDLRVLPKKQQQSYTQTIAHTYRDLADLLLKQDRVLEAQKVLDLLKVQELEDYLRNVRGNNQTAAGLPNLPPEEQFNQNYNALINKAIELGKELTQLEKIPELNRTPQQQQRITELRNNQQKILTEFNAFIRSPAVETIVQQLSNTAKRQNVELEDLNSLRDNLKKLEQNAVLLYPLILDDRLELVLVTADSPPIHRTVPVKREDLNRAIAQFRTALEDSNSDAKTPAHELYDWLIKPIENELSQANAQTIIYAPDGQLRYIPLAALYDGNQWLVQRWRVNNITAKSLTDFNTQPQHQLRVLAAAFTKGSYNFNIGNQQFSFNGLPFAGVEVENLATELPGTTKLLDNAFSREGTVSRMNDYTIVHLATHAAFVTGKPEDSFVLFGDGSRATLRDVENWSLPNVDLVVFSACETGLGGFGNGAEILGLGYQLQRTGARAAIASLWSVSDGGTQALMDTFYAALQTGKMTKAEALRQAQVALITGDYKALGEQRGLGVQQRINSSLPEKVSTKLSHPYYWSPFILIGNGL